MIDPTKKSQKNDIDIENVLESNNQMLLLTADKNDSSNNCRLCGRMNPVRRLNSGTVYYEIFTTILFLSPSRHFQVVKIIEMQNFLNFTSF